MKMNKKTDELKALTDEFYYLICNEKFKKEIEKFRTRHKIPKEGFNNYDKKYNAWWNRSVKEIKKFEFDLISFSKRCRVSRSRYVANFLPILRNYILTSKVSHYFKMPISALPDLEIKSSSNNLVIKIKLDSDTTQKDISKIIKAEWLKIRKLQKTIGGSRLKPAKKLDANIEIWTLSYRRAKDVNEILALVEKRKIKNISEDAWSVHGIRKIIDRTSLRIQNSFN